MISIEIWILFALLFTSKTKNDYDLLNAYHQNFLEQFMQNELLVASNSPQQKTKPLFYANDNFLYYAFYKAYKKELLKESTADKTLNSFLSKYWSMFRLVDKHNVLIVEANQFQSISLHPQTETIFSLLFDAKDFITEETMKLPNE